MNNGLGARVFAGVLSVGALVALVAAVINSLPDIKRYLRIRSM